MEGSAREEELMGLSDVVLKRCDGNITLSFHDSQQVRRAVAVAMERLGTDGVDYDDFWDVMDYLHDRGLTEEEGMIDVVRHHVTTLNDFRGLKGEYG